MFRMQKISTRKRLYQITYYLLEEGGGNVLAKWQYIIKVPRDAFWLIENPVKGSKKITTRKLFRVYYRKRCFHIVI